MKKGTIFFIIVIIVFILALLAIFVLKRDNISNSNEELNSTGNLEIIYQDKLAMHNLESDCWVAYNGKVYDITDFLPKHPGTAGKIIPYCGTSSEFENAFTQKHGTTKASMLMKVGTLIGDFDKVGNL